MLGIMFGSGDVKMNKRVSIPLLLGPGVLWILLIEFGALWLKFFSAIVPIFVGINI